MPITRNNAFKGRQHPGELIILCVRLYLRYPLSDEHVAELIAECGVEVDASCMWRWVQAHAPELNKRCRPHLKPVNKSYRIDETYIRVISLNALLNLPVAAGEEPRLSYRASATMSPQAAREKRIFSPTRICRDGSRGFR